MLWIIILILIILIIFMFRTESFVDSYGLHDMAAKKYADYDKIEATYLWDIKDPMGNNVYDIYYYNLLEDYNKVKSTFYHQEKPDDPSTYFNGEKINLAQKYY